MDLRKDPGITCAPEHRGHPAAKCKGAPALYGSDYAIAT